MRVYDVPVILYIFLYGNLKSLIEIAADNIPYSGNRMLIRIDNHIEYN